MRCVCVVLVFGCGVRVSYVTSEDFVCTDVEYQATIDISGAAEVEAYANSLSCVKLEGNFSPARIGTAATTRVWMMMVSKGRR